jgi:hypothetical protein
MLFIFENKCFRFLSYPRTLCLSKRPVRFSSVDPRGMDNRSFVSLLRIFIVILYFKHSILYYPECHSSFWILVIQLNYGHSKRDWSEPVLLLENLRKQNSEHLDFCDENRYSALWESFITPCCSQCKVNLFVSFHIQGLYILQGSCQIFVVSLALGETISYSVYPDIQVHFIYSRCHISLLSLVFISFRVTVIRLTYGHSKLAIEFDL